MIDVYRQPPRKSNEIFLYGGRNSYNSFLVYGSKIICLYFCRICTKEKKQPIKSVSRIHVRRTDKTSEAKYHILDEYMVYVKEWFDAYEYLHKEIVRKIYLATDEPKLLEEARNK